MSTLPASGYLSNNARTEGEEKVAFESQRDSIEQAPGNAAEADLTIAAGVVTPTRSSHRIDTEAAAAADDLDNILTTNHPEGRIIFLRSVDAGRVVTVRHAQGGAGQVYLADAVNRVLSISDHLALYRVGTDWRELSAEQRALLHAARVDNPHSVTKSQVGLSEVANLKVNLSAVVAPAVTDDSASGYAIGSRWIDTVTDKEYVAADVTVGAAVWVETTATGGAGGTYMAELFSANGT